MKAIEILKQQPVKPEPPKPTFGKGKTAEAAKEQYLSAVASYDRESREYPTKRKEYKKSVFDRMSNKDVKSWLTTVRDFHGLRTGKKSAKDTMVSTWISDFRKAFKNAFPGQQITALKSGVQITDYIVEDAESEEVKKLTATISALLHRFPPLFVKGLTPEAIAEVINREEELAREQVVLAHELRDLEELKRETTLSLEEVNEKVVTFEQYSTLVPEPLTHEMDRYNNRLQDLDAQIAARTN